MLRLHMYVCVLVIEHPIRHFTGFFVLPIMAMSHDFPSYEREGYFNW